MRSNQQHVFSQIPSLKTERSVFNRSFAHKTTFDSGYLVPIMVDEVLPGDTFHVKASIFARVATLFMPIMDNLFLDTFYFFVPARLLWEHWTSFMGERRQPLTAQPIEYSIPTITAPGPGWDSKSIFDYMGLPVQVAVYDVNVLPLRAYNLIYNEWFRDQNLCELAPQIVADSDVWQNYELKKRGKRPDYFTSCLPWPQKGDPVDIGIAGTAEVWGDGNAMQFSDGSGPETSHFIIADLDAQSWKARTGNGYSKGTDTSGLPLSTDQERAIGLVRKGEVSGTSTSGLYADLSTAAAVTINQLREAFQIQKMLERDARGGTRYTEIIQARFGIRNPDFRLQRPEYLGGSRTRILVNSVTKTSENTPGSVDERALGSQAAYCIGTDQSGGFAKSFTEHGYIIGLACVIADLNYPQGINRMWNRVTREDFFWPELAHLGEQEVYTKEIWAGDTTTHNPVDASVVFGYQERYAEYRYKQSYITGLFRTDIDENLAIWHLAQNLTAQPHLNKDFIEENPPIDRVSLVQNSNSEFYNAQIIFDSFFDMKCARPMPVYSVPGLIDHF